jgi:hypothetical protein
MRNTMIVVVAFLASSFLIYLPSNVIHKPKSGLSGTLGLSDVWEYSNDMRQLSKTQYACSVLMWATIFLLNIGSWDVLAWVE